MDVSEKPIIYQVEKIKLMVITRNPETASRSTYDLIIVGGGIYGTMLTYEAIRKGISTLLLEKKDFGWATSYNSLRIIHGGLRDLQSLNLKRFSKFGAERDWFLDNFDNLVKPLPVLMPLYQKGLKRKGLFRTAFMFDRFFSGVNHNVDRKVPFGKIVDSETVKRMFPLVNDEGLKGGAIWYDAAVPDSQRLIIEVLRRANQLGATTLNYMQAEALEQLEDIINGVSAKDVLTGNKYIFNAKKVVNATGPWCRELAAGFDKDYPELFRQSLAWNILFDRDAPADYALGVYSNDPDGQIYFLHPWKGKLFAGTGHVRRDSREDNPEPTPEEIGDFIAGLNSTVPGLDLHKNEILHIYSGNLSIKDQAGIHLTKKDYFIDHGEHGGPSGLYSIGSSKFTAARSTAEEIIERIITNRARGNHHHQPEKIDSGVRGLYDYNWYPEETDYSWKQVLKQIIKEESVQHLDDVILRRTNLGDNPARALRIAPEICELFGWDDQCSQIELKDIQDYFEWVSKPAYLNK